MSESLLLAAPEEQPRISQRITPSPPWRPTAPHSEPCPPWSQSSPKIHPPCYLLIFLDLLFPSVYFMSEIHLEAPLHATH